MKKIILSILLVATEMVALGQTTSSEAFSKSYTYETNKDYTKAVSSITAVYDASSYTMNLRLGWLEYLAGEYIKSESYYKKAIVLEQKSVEARLGSVYPISATGNWDEVIKVYSEILTIDPQNSTVNYRMAYIYFVRKDYERAASYAQKVVKLYPFDFDSNYLLGQIYVTQGKILEAKMYLTRAVEYNPTSTEAKSLLGKL
jgi:tetratricopeptide (TPR) repeat protein